MYKTYRVTVHGKTKVAGMIPISETFLNTKTAKEAVRIYRKLHLEAQEKEWGMKVKVLGADKV